MSTEQNDKKERTRSPAYPAIGLEEAIAKAGDIWKKANRHAVPVDVLGTYWGYDAKSSTGISASSAMKKYGLLIEEGAKEKRNLKLSELAIKLIYNPDINSPEYTAALKEAALKPAIHAELWSKYGGNLPDDGVIKRYLVVERKFNDAYVDSFIGSFRQTIAFAKLSESDTILTGKEQSEILAMTNPAPTSEAHKHVARQTDGQRQTVLPQQPESSDLALPLESGKVVRIPQMTEGDYDLMLDTLKLWKRRIVVQNKPDSQVLPGDGE